MGRRGSAENRLEAGASSEPGPCFFSRLVPPTENTETAACPELGKRRRAFPDCKWKSFNHATSPFPMGALIDFHKEKKDQVVVPPR